MGMVVSAAAKRRQVTKNICVRERRKLFQYSNTHALLLLCNAANTRHISAVAVKYQLNKTIITACAQTTSAKKR